MARLYIRNIVLIRDTVKVKKRIQRTEPGNQRKLTYIVGFPVPNNVRWESPKNFAKYFSILVRSLLPEPISLNCHRISDKAVLVFGCLVWVRTRRWFHKIIKMRVTIGHLGRNEAKMLW